MAKTAILGGSFDPIHLGHLYLLHSAVNQTDYERFIIIPAKVSNFKLDARPVSSDEARLEMLRLAIADYHDIFPEDKKEITVSDIELKRGGISYTYDTVKEIKTQYGIKNGLGLIIGDDHIEALRKWYRFEDLKKEVEFIICPRDHQEDLKKIPNDINYFLMQVPETRIESSTAVRNSIDENGNYLSKRVLAYAREKNLYN